MSVWTTTDEDYDPEILVPNRYAETLRMWFLRCPCGSGSTGFDTSLGTMGNHFLPYDPGRAFRPDAYYPGTALCRHSGRTVTLAGAVERDSQLTSAERRAKESAKRFADVDG
ncbi:hypothetical protein [Streptomyces sp. NPDC002491]